MELNFSPLQIIGLFIGGLALSKTIADYHKRKESRVMFAFWLLVWLTVITITLFPKLTELIRNYLLGPGQSIGTMIGIGMIFLLFLIYRIYLKTERVERILQEHASDLALRKIRQN